MLGAFVQLGLCLWSICPQPLRGFSNRPMVFRLFVYVRVILCTAEHLFTCNVPHEASMAKYVQNIHEVAIFSCQMQKNLSSRKKLAAHVPRFQSTDWNSYRKRLDGNDVVQNFARFSMSRAGGALCAIPDKALSGLREPIFGRHDLWGTTRFGGLTWIHHRVDGGGRGRSGISMLPLFFRSLVWQMQFVGWCVNMIWFRVPTQATVPYVDNCHPRPQLVQE